MRFVIMFLLSLLWSGEVFAKGPFNTFTVGNWVAGSYTDDKTGQFSHCAAFVQFNSKILLFVSVTRDIQWNLALMNSDWSLRVGQTLPIVLAFDNGFTSRVVGEIKNPDFVLIPMPNESGLIRAFRASHFMMSSTRGEDYHFSLDGTSRLIVELVQCASKNSSNSVAGSGGASPPADTNVAMAPKSDAEKEQDRLLDEAAAEHFKCLQTQMRQIVPYSNESAEVLAQVILTNCAEAEKKFVSLGIAIFKTTRAETERIVGEALAEQKKKGLT